MSEAEQAERMEKFFHGKSFRILGCKGHVVTTEDGKAHVELECKSKKERDELSAVWEEEAILRINPKLVLEDTPASSESPPGSEESQDSDSQEQS